MALAICCNKPNLMYCVHHHTSELKWADLSFFAVNKHWGCVTFLLLLVIQKLQAAQNGLEPVRILNGHVTSISSIAFSPSALLLVTGCSKGWLNIWALQVINSVFPFSCSKFALWWAVWAVVTRDLFWYIKCFGNYFLLGNANWNFVWSCSVAQILRMKLHLSIITMK